MNRIPSYHNNSDPAPSSYQYPDETDNLTRASCDSLAYSDITGEIGTLMSTVSNESRRLNGFTPRRPNNNYYRPPSARGEDYDYEESNNYGDWIHQPRIRACFGIAVALAICTVFVLTSGAIDSEWLENIWDMGLKGARAQRMADASLIKTPTIHSGDHTISLGDSPKQQVSIDSDPPNGCETTIMLIRHCEKGNLRSHCNYNGFERAAYLASLFGDDAERWPAPSDLYALKVGGRGKRKGKVNYREVETVQYIADKHSLDINQDYSTKDHKALARDLLGSVLNGEQCGKLTLVSWKHSDLPRLAHLLGKCLSRSSREHHWIWPCVRVCVSFCHIFWHISSTSCFTTLLRLIPGCGPYEGCPMDYRGKEFDQVWQIKFVYRSFHHGPKAKSTNKQWDIFGSVQYEHFDPLAFSKTAGDYPQGGTNHAGRWVMPDQKLFD
jgi:hypothetical protein